MTDEEKQRLLGLFCDGKLDVNGLTDGDFVGLLDALRRMFNARVWNCVDASGKWDREWLTLSDVLYRVLNMLKVEDVK